MKTAQTSLTWTAKEEIINIHNLKELLDVLIKIKQKDIDNEINKNLDNLISWLEKEYPDKLIFTTRLKVESKEYTCQQIRERLIRDLRGFMDKS
jgi:Rad3-related DNA helicase